MSFEHNLSERLEPYIRLIAPTTNLIVGHTREHRSRPEGIIPRILAVFSRFMYSSCSIGAITRLDNLTFQCRKTIYTCHGYKE